MKKFRVVFLLSLCLIICAGNSVSSQEGNPTLKETVDWLQSKAYLITYVGASSLQKTIQGKRNGKWEVVLTNPCNIELRNNQAESTAQVRSNKRGSKNDSRQDGGPHGSVDMPRWAFYVDPPQDPSVITIPLADLNPQKTTSAIAKGNIITGGNVSLSATDDKEVIIWRGADKTFNAKSIIIGFQQDGMTERVTKALTHAINLCGGKADKKEPF